MKQKFFKKEGVKFTIKVVEKDSDSSSLLPCQRHVCYVVSYSNALQKKLALAHEAHNYNSYIQSVLRLESIFADILPTFALTNGVLVPVNFQNSVWDHQETTAMPNTTATDALPHQPAVTMLLLIACRWMWSPALNKNQNTCLNINCKNSPTSHCAALWAICEVNNKAAQVVCGDPVPPNSLIKAIDCLYKHTWAVDIFR